MGFHYLLLPYFNIPYTYLRNKVNPSTRALQMGGDTAGQVNGEDTAGQV